MTRRAGGTRALARQLLRRPRNEAPKRMGARSKQHDPASASVPQGFPKGAFRSGPCDHERSLYAIFDNGAADRPIDCPIGPANAGGCRRCLSSRPDAIRRRLSAGGVLRAACVASSVRWGSARRPVRGRRAGGFACRGGASTLRVVQGDRIELRWTSDEVATLHLHGYEVEATVAPGAPATMVFEAYATGRFPIVAHGFGKSGGSTTTPQREKTLLYLEVHPR